MYRYHHCCSTACCGCTRTITAVAQLLLWMYSYHHCCSTARCGCARTSTAVSCPPTITADRYSKYYCDVFCALKKWTPHCASYCHPWCDRAQTSTCQTLWSARGCTVHVCLKCLLCALGTDKAPAKCSSLWSATGCTARLYLKCW